MRKSINISFAMLSIGTLIVSPLAQQVGYRSLSVYAQETHTVESVYSLVIGQTPVTESQWYQIPTEDWLRYAENTLVPDGVLFQAYLEHPEVFTPESNRIRTILIEQHNVNASVVNNVSDLDILWKEYSVYLKNNKEDFKELASYYGQESRVNEMSEPYRLYYTREEVIEQMKNGGADDFKGALIRFGGITEDMLARVPEDAIFNAAVEHRMRNIHGGDWGTALATFKRMYPEAFNKTTKPLAEEVRQAKIEKSTQNQQILMQHIQNTTSNNQYLALKDNHVLTFDSGKYELKHIFLLHPEEAGNRSTEHYMLGIRYEYTNTTNQEVAVDSEEFIVHSSVSQFNDTDRILLDSSTYELLDDTQSNENIETVITPIQPGKKTKGTLYFTVPNAEEDLVLSVIQKGKVEEYKLEMETLLKLPPQSASYVTDESALLGYIFDFDKLYLVYEVNADMSRWASQKGVAISRKVEELSKEATTHYRQFKDRDTLLVELSDIRYKIKENQVIGMIKDEAKPIIHLITTTNWQDFQDRDNVTYWKR